MKLTDFLQDVGRPVAYFPKLRRLTGSTTATILLCQFIYWRGKESSGDGWLYKTAQEIESETGLTYNEQKTARAALKEAGLIQEHYARLDHQMRFKVDLDAINEKWGVADAKNGECDDSTFGNDESQFSLNESENTTENTTDASASKPDLLDMELSKLPAMSIRKAIHEYFRLNVNWETKTARQWLEWAHGENITAEQIERAAQTWREDKAFNWQTPTLKGIFEKWQLLMDASKPIEQPEQEKGKGFYA